MAILIDRHTKLLTMGFTGKQGTFHSLESRDYGTDFVGGVHPQKGGTIHEGYPIFTTVAQAMKKTEANAAMIFVPALFAADAILECIDAKIPLVVCITEGIPVHDMFKIRAALSGSATRLIGPNCPGVISPGECKVGIMPSNIHMPGSVGIISRSGTLTYEAVYQLTNLEIGQSTCVGIGGDPILGTGFIDLLEMFENDSQTKSLLLLGEIGGCEEIEAAKWIKKYMSKPVVAYITGATAPEGKKMGHAGAIACKHVESVEYKIKELEKCGILVARTPDQIGTLVKSVQR